MPKVEKGKFGTCMTTMKLVNKPWKVSWQYQIDCSFNYTFFHQFDAVVMLIMLFLNKNESKLDLFLSRHNS